ncbi:MAG: glycine--tRNA ligase subunit beta [Caulobacterales bacterium]|jgi:glycyl-tRNA synthetase beta chain
MPQLLIELHSEEIPARMQARAEADLRKAVTERLAAAGLAPESLRTFSGPRRLGLAADGLPARQKDQVEDKKGPRVGAPEPAIQGFLKSAGLADLSQATVVEDKKGDYYLARINRPGRETAAVLAEMLADVIRTFPWPKSMRSGESDLTWVRPLRNILLSFDGEAIAVDVQGVPSVGVTYGHRFHAPAAIPVRRFEDYEQKLRKAFVVTDRDERKQTILTEARTLCAAQELELVEDPGLLEEVAGLSEWPVVLMGQMDPAFLDLPAEVIRLTMRTHQKYFAVRDPKSGRLAPKFITVANIEAHDGGQAIAAGNARVLSARLNDARFFWAKDLETPLFTEERREKLKGLIFHAKLGSVWDKVVRVAALARELAPACDADPDLAEQAARLCKIDLVTETVGEFPELQGQIGRQLFEATEKNPNPAIAAAIEDHYRPLGPNDRVPTDPVAVTLALADKLDSLVGFWAIDEKPTGSGDAYGSRRAALGLVRTILENNVRLRSIESAGSVRKRIGANLRGLIGWHGRTAFQALKLDDKTLRLNVELVLAFLADRLKVQLRDQGQRHDLVDAVFALGDDDLVRIVAKVEALTAFLQTDDGKNLLAGFKRAANILKAEEKKDTALAVALANPQISPSLFSEPAEIALHAAITKASAAAQEAMLQERFADAMKALAGLRAPVDAFFEGVLVNAEKPEVRANRLALLALIRDSLGAVADFTKIEG